MSVARVLGVDIDTPGAHVAFANRGSNNDKTSRRVNVNMDKNQIVLLDHRIKSYSIRVANIRTFTHLTLSQKRDFLEETATFLQNLRHGVLSATLNYPSISEDVQILENIVVDMGYYIFPEWFPHYFTQKQVLDLHRQFDLNDKCVNLDTGFMTSE